ALLRYELTDHLGNVGTVVTGRLLPGDGAPHEAEVISAQGYEPFGSLLPGRNYSSGSYRFGFNSQEKDDEVFGATGTSMTAEFWQYDTRTGRRWNLDPVPVPSMSGYSVLGSNPILHVDPLGDTWDISQNKQSKADAQSLVKKDNQKYMTFTDGHVGLNFGDLSKEEIAGLMKADEGLSLVNDLVSSEKKFLYGATDFALIRDGEGAKAGIPMYTIDSGVINASEGGKDSAGGHTHRPQAGYDGQVVIHPDANYQEQDASGAVIKKSRAATVFHELAENYQRTHHGIDYQGASGAHNLAIQRENKWWGKSNMPGKVLEGLTIPKPTEERKPILKGIIDKYMGNP
ncbi:MAG TPA: hypothetical protein PKC42_04330, partial [Candidatus Nanoperiomorbaceae bacterium]|nr:hypothetical protein [Candidatus Nanoperiomorbaceae bacterium]